MQVEEKKGLEWRKSTNHVPLTFLFPVLPEVEEKKDFSGAKKYQLFPAIIRFLFFSVLEAGGANNVPTSVYLIYSIVHFFFG